MIYCTSCGSPNLPEAVVCEVCGAALPRTGAAGAARPNPVPPQPPPRPAQPAPPPPPPPPAPPSVPDELSGAEKIGIFAGNLCLSPLLGVVLYFVWKGRHPRRAGQACTLTWWTIGIYVVMILGMMMLGVMAQMTGM